MSRSPRPEPIAIIGSGCRLPGGANSPSQLWSLLTQSTEIKPQSLNKRFNLDRFYHPDNSHHGTLNAEEAYLLDQDVCEFDAAFFGIPPNEAAAIDPQHRLLMETVYEALEAAGQRLSDLRGSDTAVYVGITSYDHFAQAAQDLNSLPTYNSTGAAACNASARLSYSFDWHGPCMTIDTACSSSMVAVNQAVQVLRQGTSKVAVAAGTNLLLSPLGFIAYSNMHMLSPKGRCQMWDADGQGYVRAEGVASLILKRMSDAIADGDHIECVIREVGVNQDGRTKGITMPSATAQANLMRETYLRTGLDPTNARDRCQYFEAHGTGTAAGDPLEAEAIHSVFFASSPTSEHEKMLVGGIKTVIGHTEATAGIAGILKASLAMKHGVIPRNLHFNKLNPRIAPFYGNLHLVTEQQRWPALPEGEPRRVSVNSFGFGGTNSHVILESCDESFVDQSLPSQSLLPLIFSAPSRKSLEALLVSYKVWLDTSPHVDLTRLALTLTCRRTLHPFRVVIGAGEYNSTYTEIDNLLAGDISRSMIHSTSNKIISLLGVFTGQGAQWPQMGAALARSSQYVRGIIAELDQALSTLPIADRPAWSILEELLADKSCSRVGEATIAQPLTCAVQLILTSLLQRAGVHFSAVVGHSSGEIAAAYAAGFLSRQDTIRIAYYRGLHSKLAGSENGQPGSMLAVGMSMENATELCARPAFQGRISVAASNSGSSVTLSGDEDAILEVKTLLDNAKTFARLLRVDKAYHSRHMRRASEPFLKSLGACRISLQSPPDGAPKWFSSVRNEEMMVSSSGLEGPYWNDNLNSPVLFSQAIEAAVKAMGMFDAAMEVGAHPALKGPACEVHQACSGQALLTYIGCLSRDKNDVNVFSRALGELMALGGDSVVNLEGFHQTLYDAAGPVEPLQGLPAYPWDHERALWSESRIGRLIREQPGRHHELLGTREPGSISEHCSWRNILLPKQLPWLSDHSLQGQLVFPVTGYLSLCIEAAMEVAGKLSVQAVEITDLRISKGIAIDSKTGTEIMVSLSNIVQDSKVLTASFLCSSVISRNSTLMQTNAIASIKLLFGPSRDDVLLPRTTSADGLRSVDVAEFYDELARLGYGYGSTFRSIRSLTRTLGRSSGTISCPSQASAFTALLFHPGMLDAALQGLLAAYSAPGDGRLWSLHAPSFIRKLIMVPSLCSTAMAPQLIFDATITDESPCGVVGDIELYQSAAGNQSISIEGAEFVPLSPALPSDDRELFAHIVHGPQSLVSGTANANREILLEKLRSGPVGALEGSILGLDGATLSVLVAIIHRFPKSSLRVVEDVVSSPHQIANQLKIGEATCDVLVFPNGISCAGHELQQALCNIRGLINSGGYLVMNNVVEQTPGEQTSTSGKNYTYMNTWTEILLRAGFSAPNTSLDGLIRADTSSTVLTAQAIGGETDSSDGPTLSEDCALPRKHDLILVGGNRGLSGPIANKILSALKHRYSRVFLVARFADLTPEQIAEGSTLLSLVELDTPFWSMASLEGFEKLQSLFEVCRNILWITWGADRDNVGGAITIGTLRSLRHLLPHSQIQIIDFESFDQVDFELVKSSILHLEFIGARRQIGGSDNKLFTLEPEIRVRDGQILIPRILPLEVANNRFNANKRTITKSVAQDESVVELKSRHTKPGFSLGLGKMTPVAGVTDLRQIRVSFSLLMPLSKSMDSYLSIGTDVSTNERILAMSTESASQIWVPASRCLVVKNSDAADDQYLELVLGYLLSRAAKNVALGGKSVVLCDGSSRIALIIACCLQGLGDIVVLRMLGEGPHTRANLVQMHPRTPDRQIREMLPRNAKTFIDLTDASRAPPATSDLGDRVASNLANSCVRLSAADLMTRKWLFVGKTHIWNVLADADVFARAHAKTITARESLLPVVSLRELVVATEEIKGFSIVNWQADATVPIEIEPIMQSGAPPLCHGDRTYWLVDFEESVARSICNFLVSQGALQIVVTDSTEDQSVVDRAWAKNFHIEGLTIKSIPGDVFDADDLIRVYTTIQSTMAPIAGIAVATSPLQARYGAEPVDSLSVCGTLGVVVAKFDNLNRMSSTSTFDFFMAISSIAAVGGAGADMRSAQAAQIGDAHVRQRRARGLAASHVHIPRVLGLGHDLPRDKLVPFISESDFHHALAEGLRAGQTDNFADPTVLAGINSADVSKSLDARFGYYACDEDKDGKNKPDASHGTDTLSLAMQLAACESKEEMVLKLTDAFIGKLKNALMIDGSLSTTTPLVDVGVDSLVAVDIRTWFEQEADTSVAVMKVLGGDSVSDIVEDVVVQKMEAR